MGLVGVILCLIGGLILAIPLLAYLVGVASPQVATGTGAIAVAIDAATGFVFPVIVLGVAST